MDRKDKIPLIVIMLMDGTAENGRLFVVVMDNESVVAIVRVPQQATKVKFGVQYHKYNMGNGGQAMSWDKEVITNTTNWRIGYGVLLPLLDKEIEEEGRLFSLVSSNCGSG